MAEKKRHSHNDGWQLHAAAGKKRMAEKKEKKGAKLTDEGNRTQVSKIKRDHKVSGVLIRTTKRHGV